MGIVRQERLDDSKKNKLIEAAIHEFTERGIERASYNKIIERSGLSKGTVYYYFDNKETLLLMVLEVIADRFIEAIGALPLPETKEQYWEIAWEYHKRIIEFFLENSSLSYVLLRLTNDLSMDERLESIQNRISNYMNRLLIRGQELGTIRNDLPIATINQLVQAMGSVLSAEILGNSNNPCDGSDKEAVRGKVKSFISSMHDLSMRVLAPREDENNV